MFKNATIYKLVQPLTSSSRSWAAIGDALADAEFAPCGPSTEKSVGFVPPRAEHGAMIEVVEGQVIIKVMVETKSVPASMIAREYQAKVAEIESTTGRKPGKKEGREIKDDIRLALMPHAFPKAAAVFVWIDPMNSKVAIDTTSTSRLDDVLSLLVHNIEGFSVAHISTSTSPAALMALSLTEGEFTQDFSIDRECELKASDESKSVVKYAKHPLDTDEVKRHIKQGKMPTKLALTWKDRLSFVLTEDFQLKKLAFLDLVFSEGMGKADKDDDRFDADVTIATKELRNMLVDLLDAHGGETEVGADDEDDEL